MFEPLAEVVREQLHRTRQRQGFIHSQLTGPPGKWYSPSFAPPMRTASIMHTHNGLHGMFVAATGAVAFLCVPLLASAQCGTIINTFPYNEGFESSAAWTSAGSGNDWIWGTPAHPLINSAGGGTKSWCVGGLTGTFYNLSELAWIESPCFDFTALDHPWISFKIFWECERQYDGMTFQYSLDGGTTYSNVGAYNDPTDCMNQNWFNSANISNLTGISPKHGWSGRVGATQGSCQGGSGSGAWITASHCMSSLAYAPSVRFRFLFGAGTTCNSYDGIAVDDIVIGNAPADQPQITSTCSGDTLHFINASTDCPSVFAWSFGDVGSGALNFSNVPDPVHVYTGPGNYTVSFTTSGPCNPSGNVTIPISILDVSVNATDALCGGNTGAADAVVGYGNGTEQYLWQPGGQNTASVSGLAAGDYILTVSSAGSCAYEVPFTIAQPANALAVDIAPTAPNCHGGNDGSAVADANGGTGPYAYAWSPFGGSNSTASALTAGNFTLTLTDASGCELQQDVLITEPDELLINTAASVDICSGASTTLTADAIGGMPGYTFTWSPSGPDVSPTTSTAFTVSVTDAHGCIGVPAQVMVNVGTALVPSIIAVDTAGCAPQCPVLSASPAGMIDYAWSFSDGSSANGSNVNPCFNSDGDVDVTLVVTDANGCTGSIVAPHLVHVWPVPSAGFTAPDVVIITDPPTRLMDESNGATAWSWEFGTLNGGSEPSPLFDPPGLGCFPVMQVVSNALGCIDTARAEICVEDEFALYAPNAFTPNGDGMNDAFGIISSVGSPSYFQLLIFDRWGGIIFSSSSPADAWEGKNVPDGVYAWRVMLRDSQEKLRKATGHVVLLR